MILRRIVARSMSEALQRVENEIGPEALIVDTSQQDGLTTIFARRPETASATQTQRAARARRSLPRSRTLPQDAVRSQLEDVYMSERIIKVVFGAVEGLDPDLLRKGSRSLPGVVRKVLAGLIRCSPTRQKRVALVGPTGVGKTTTIAKLAARDALENGLATGIVTTDTYRVAAVEQLRAFADMMELPFRVAFTPQDLRTALREMSTLDRVWIDSSGRNPRDENALRGIRGLFGGLDIEVLLCLPAAARRRELEHALRAFGAFKPDALVACKWDETDAPGELISLAIERDLAIAGHGTGQRVPEDWNMPDASRYALDLLPEDPQ